MIQCPGRPDTDSIYGQDYERLFNSGGLTGWGYRKTHRDVENYTGARHVPEILEIGAGAGEHLSFVRVSFDRYVMVDLRPSPVTLPFGPDQRLEWLQADASEMLFEENSFDRVVSMCVLHHVTDLDAILGNIRFWLRPGGTFSLFLPTDPGILNGLNRRVVVNRRARRLGITDYLLCWAREHRNHYWSIEKQLRSVFEGYDLKVHYWPFHVPIPDLNLYSIWHISKP